MFVSLFPSSTTFQTCLMPLMSFSVIFIGNCQFGPRGFCSCRCVSRGSPQVKTNPRGAAGEADGQIHSGNLSGNMTPVGHWNAKLCLISLTWNFLMIPVSLCCLCVNVSSQRVRSCRGRAQFEVHICLSAVSASLQHVRLSLHRFSRLTERTCPHPAAERRALTLRDKH